MTVALPQVGGDVGAWGQELNDFLSVAHNPDGTLKQYAFDLTRFGADPTGATYSDAAFKSAALAAAAVVPSSLNTTGTVVLTGPAGVYKFQHNIALPANVALGQFGGGGYECAMFWFPNESGYPTALALTNGAVSPGATSVVLKGASATFDPVGDGVPRPFIMGGMVCYYTGVTGSSPTPTLTGVTGVTSGVADSQPLIANTCVLTGSDYTSRRPTIIDNTVLVQGPTTSYTATGVQPTNVMDGVMCAPSCRMDCSVGGFRHAFVIWANHEAFGPSARGSSCYSEFAFLSPTGLNWSNVSSGDQIWETGGIHSAVNAWCTVFVGANTASVTGRFHGHTHFGNAPWFMWKEATAGVANASILIALGMTVEAPSMEGYWAGLVGAGTYSGSELNGFTWGGGGSFQNLGGVSHNGIYQVANLLNCSVGGGFGGYSDGPLFACDVVTASGIDSVSGLVSSYSAPIIGGSTAVELGLNGGALVSASGTVAAGDLLQVNGLANNNFTPMKYLRYNSNSLPISGVAVSAISNNCVVMATDIHAGPIKVNVATGGDIVSGTLVRAAGTTAPGKAKTASGAFDTTAPSFGFAYQNDSAGQAVIVLPNPLR